MNIFVKSLQRLYHSGRVTGARITELLKENKIIQEDYDYIIGA